MGHGHTLLLRRSRHRRRFPTTREALGLHTCGRNRIVRDFRVGLRGHGLLPSIAYFSDVALRAVMRSRSAREATDRQVALGW